MRVSAKRIAKGLYWDRAWSLVEGCSPVSAGCDHCWAARQAHMRASNPNEGIRAANAGLATAEGWIPGVVRERWDKLEEPLLNSTPTVYAIWTDLFHEAVKDDFIKAAWGTMNLCPQHLFLILTKRADRMFSVVTSIYGSAMAKPQPNIWLGVTAETGKRFHERGWKLINTPAAIRFLSLEPLMAYVTVSDYDICKCGDWRHNHDSDGRCLVCRDSHSQPFPPCKKYALSHPYFDWVIMGAEKGPGARPMDLDWARKVRDDCAAAGVPLFYKGDGKSMELDGELIQQFPELKR